MIALSFTKYFGIIPTQLNLSLVLPDTYISQDFHEPETATVVILDKEEVFEQILLDNQSKAGGQHLGKWLDIEVSQKSRIRGGCGCHPAGAEWMCHRGS